MKLTILLVTVTLLSAQAESTAQNVTISGKDLTLKEVFAAIEKQTGYVVFSHKDLFANKKTVSLTVHDLPLKDLLDILLKDEPLKYVMGGKTIFLSRKATAVSSPFEYASLPVTGCILGADGQALAGVTVRVKGSKKGTATDNNGNFSLDMNEGEQLEISSVGFVSLTIQLVNNKFQVVSSGRPERSSDRQGNDSDRSQLLNANPDGLLIRIARSNSQLEEVVVSTGYWTTTKQRSTGNISKVTAKDIERQPVTSPLMALQGRVPGLEITPQNGAPGAAPKIRIRGSNSLRERYGSLFDNGNYPLYVIDGLIIDSRPLQSQVLGEGAYRLGVDPLVGIGPGNIESIEILKDAGATAIYGSQGANGVILITTKKGSRQNKTDFDISVYKGAGKIPAYRSLLNTQQYLEIRREAFANTGQMPDMFEWDLVRWDSTRYTDWQKELLGGASTITDLQVGFSGGSALTNFRLSGGFYKEGTILPGDFGNKRVTGSFNFNHRSTNDKLNVSFVANYGKSMNKLFVNNGQYVSAAINLAPNAPKLYNADGSLNWDTVHNAAGTYRSNAFNGNPIKYLLQPQESDIGTWAVNSHVSYKILPGLKLSATLGFSETNGEDLQQEPIAAMQYSPFATGRTGRAYFSYNKRNTWQIEPQLNYSQTKGKHHYEVFTGLSFRSSYAAYQAIAAEGYTSDVLLNTLKGATSWQFMTDNENKYRYTATFGRLHYNYSDKYLVDLTARRDGSSRFGPNNKFGNFGAIAAGWIFTGERFVSDHLRFLSFGKLRSSYGVTASDNIGDYKFYDLFDISPAGYGGSLLLLPAGLYNPDYQWERTKKLEFALELGVIDNKVMIEASWYRNRSDNQLVDYQLPMTTGFGAVAQNFEAVIQNTGWEFVATSKNISSKNFQWTTSVNISFPSNKLISFPGIETSPYAGIYKVGEPLNIQKRFIWEGVDPASGKIIFRDINNDGAIDYQNDQVFMKMSDQKYHGGISNDFRYKSFNISFLLQFADPSNGHPALPSTFGRSFGNMTTDVLSRWQKPGDITDIGRLTSNLSVYNSSFGLLGSSSYNIVDASFLRLKTLSVSYSLPSGIIERARLKECTLFMQGQNLLTITGYKGVDPETGPGSLPLLRMITGGVRVKF